MRLKSNSQKFGLQNPLVLFIIEEKLGEKAILHPIQGSKVIKVKSKVINNEQLCKFCHIFSQFFASMVEW